jgi:hypothetical protein
MMTGPFSFGPEQLAVRAGVAAGKSDGGRISQPIFFIPFLKRGPLAA